MPISLPAYPEMQTNNLLFNITSLDGDLESIITCWVSYLRFSLFETVFYQESEYTYNASLQFWHFTFFLLNFFGMVIWSKMDLVLNVLA